ncbi:MAG: class I SAM-dependent methyltransferase [Planktomarina sp.]
MTYNYDALYENTPDALGAPTQVFVDFFQSRSDMALHVLDVGCGQGRDALHIARAGHSVVGVDLSSHSVQAIVAVAEGLAIKGEVADLCDYTLTDTFDVVLIDLTLHMLAADERDTVLTTLLDCIAENGCCLIADEPSNLDAFVVVAENHAAPWQVEKHKGGDLFLSRS